MVLMVIAPGILFAAESSSGKALDIKGDVRYMKAGSSEWSKLEPTTIIQEGDTIKTGADSQVKLDLTGAAKTAALTVREGTEFKFDTFRHEAAKEQTLLNVNVGNVLIQAEKLMGDSKFEVKTPTSIVGIRGTTFEVNVPKAGK